jgi:hypothetical protein
VLKVTFVNKQVAEEAIVVDRTVTVEELTVTLARHFNLELRFTTDFSLKHPDRPMNEWYSPGASLWEQHVVPFQTVMMAKNYYFQDPYLTQDDATVLMLTYIQAKQRYMAEEFFVRTADMIQLATLLTVLEQVKLPVQTLKGLVPPRFECELALLSEVAERAKKLRGYSISRAQYEFVRKCEETPTYACTLFQAKHHGKSVILGIGPKSIGAYEPSSHVCSLAI